MSTTMALLQSTCTDCHAEKMSQGRCTLNQDSSICAWHMPQQSVIPGLALRPAHRVSGGDTT